MAEFEVNGIAYKSTKLPVMRQIKLLKRIAPLAGLVGKDVSEVGPALSDMPDEKSDYIISECMRSCERQMANGAGWAKVWNDGAKCPMFDDIEVMDLGKIVWAVLLDNYGAFFQGNA